MSRPAPPRYAVVIPHYEDAERLERCLAALASQDRADVEVAVVDNASQVDLSAIRARYPWAAFHIETTKGAGPARNRGAAETQAPWIAFLDADCVPAPDWLAAVRRAASDPRRVVGGRIEVFDETPAPRSGAEAFETVFAFDQAGYIARKGFSVTANLVVARTAFDAVGPFDDAVSEDLDWCLRATAAGHALAYDPDLTVSHPTRPDWAALAHKWRRLTREARGLALRDGARGRAIWTLRALAMPISALAHAPRVLRHPALDAGEKRRALVTLMRLRLTRAAWMLAGR